MAYEALNNAASLKSNFIIVLNDNEMSITENVGGMSSYLSGLRTASAYTDFKMDVTKALNRIPGIGAGMVVDGKLFTGIGGSGMFPLVQILHGRGYTITGSDNNESDIVNLERQMGIEVMMGQRAENIQGADLILYSAAIMDTNPELIAARESGLPLWERAKMLGAVSSWYSEALGVCGTHGKTTTTAMIVQILYMAGLDPSAVIGGKLRTIGGYGRSGATQRFVYEACEFKDTFLSTHPDIALVLNIDNDHMEYFHMIWYQRMEKF